MDSNYYSSDSHYSDTHTHMRHSDLYYSTHTSDQWRTHIDPPRHITESYRSYSSNTHAIQPHSYDHTTNYKNSQYFSRQCQSNVETEIERNYKQCKYDYDTTRHSSYTDTPYTNYNDSTDHVKSSWKLPSWAKTIHCQTHNYTLIATAAGYG